MFASLAFVNDFSDFLLWSVCLFLACVVLGAGALLTTSYWMRSRPDLRSPPVSRRIGQVAASIAVVAACIDLGGVMAGLETSMWVIFASFVGVMTGMVALTAGWSGGAELPQAQSNDDERVWSVAGDRLMRLAREEQRQAETGRLTHQRSVSKTRAVLGRKAA